MQSNSQQSLIDEVISIPDWSTGRTWVPPGDVAPPRLDIGAQPHTVFVVGDNPTESDTIRDVLEEESYLVECFKDGTAFLRSPHLGKHGCLIVVADERSSSGIALLERLKASGIDLPVIVLANSGNVAMAVAAMKAGAVDFLAKPYKSEALLSAVISALQQTEAVFTLADFRKLAAQRVASLTARQREILDLVVAGHPSKNIAADLGISQRTVENHRAAIGRKTGSRSLSALIQTALSAGCGGPAGLGRPLQLSQIPLPGSGSPLH